MQWHTTECRPLRDVAEELVVGGVDDDNRQLQAVGMPLSRCEEGYVAEVGIEPCMLWRAGQPVSVVIERNDGTHSGAVAHTAVQPAEILEAPYVWCVWKSVRGRLEVERLTESDAEQQRNGGEHVW